MPEIGCATAGSPLPDDCYVYHCLNDLCGQRGNDHLGRLLHRRWPSPAEIRPAYQARQAKFLDIKRCFPSRAAPAQQQDSSEPLLSS